MAKSKVDRVLLFMVLILAVFGLVMIASIGVSQSIRISAKNVLYPDCTNANVDCYYLFKKHLSFVALGFVALLITSKISFQVWKKTSVIIFGITIATLCAVLIFGDDNNTFAKSWLNLGPIRFQPIEFAKLGFIFYLAHWLERKSKNIESFQNGFLPFCIVSGIMLIPILLQPDVGGALVVAAIAVSMFFAAGAKAKHLIIGFSVALFAAIMIVSFTEHINLRFKAFFATDKTCTEKYCYQPEQAKIALGSGGIWGKGLTQGVQKANWLPQSGDDFIFAASSEELGFFRMFLLVLVYATIAYRGFKIAASAQNRFAMLTATGITTWITIQAFVNIAVNLALMPVTGITLPLVSFGGTSVLSIMIASGVLLHISKNTSDYAPSTLRRGNRRPHHPKRGSYSRA